MRQRHFLAAALLGGLTTLAGCPFDDLPGGGLILDGTYSGDVRSTSQVWEAGDLYWEGAADGTTTVTFVDGALLKPGGAWLDFADEDELDMGTLQVSRVVHDIDYGAWGYEVVYDLDARWGAVPMAGTQVVTYWTTAAGSLELYDDIELFSLDAYDGGAWEYEISKAGMLRPAETTDPGRGPFDDVLDRKSGKPRN